MPNGINGIIEQIPFVYPKNITKNTRERTIFSYFFNSNRTITFQLFFLYPAKSMSTTWSKEQKEVGEVVRLHLRVIAIHRRFIWPCHDTCIVAKAIDHRVFRLPERQV